MKTYLAIVLALMSTSAIAEVTWFAKPVQCASTDEVTQLMLDRKQEPLFAGMGAVRVGNDQLTFPTVVFANSEERTWHVIEYNVEVDEACVVGIGNGLDFDVADWYYNDKQS